MLIKEYRVVMPLTIDEYQVGQLYSTAQASKNETTGREGVRILANEPFENFPLFQGKFNRGQYTRKVYYLESRVPSYIRLLAPKGSLEVSEEAWNAFPFCRTVVRNPEYMGDAFSICIQSIHCNDRGEQENVHGLSNEDLKLREVHFVDIGNDTVTSGDYLQSEDPSIFKSQKTGRGPLVGNWRESVNPVMCAYKLVTVEFRWYGFQTKVESFIQNLEKKLFLKFHRQLFCWIDRWYGLTMQNIREMEERTKSELNRRLVEKNADDDDDEDNKD